MRSRLIVAAVTLFAITSLASTAATTSKNTTTKKKKPAAHHAGTAASGAVHAKYSRSSAHPSNGTKTSPTKTRTRTSAKTRGKGRRALAGRRASSQLQPTPERYTEIQKALADRGYLKTEPNGVWDTSSQDAMRAFQTDKKLDASGKLTAAALIGLGLGPKHDSPVPPLKTDPSAHPVDPVLPPPQELSPAPAQ